MSVITRVSLPEEFFDITSAQLLVQPEPQYFHAQLAKASMAAELNVADSSLGLMTGRDIPSQGGNYPANEGRLMLEDGNLSNAIMSIAGLSGQHTIRMNRPKFADTTYTLASRTVTSGSTITTTPIDVQSEQVACTVVRVAGPYDSTNSRVAPFAVDEFDAKRSVHSLAKVVGAQMKRDFDKFLDSVLVAIYDVVPSANIIRPNGFTADDDSKVAGDAPLDLDTLFRAEEQLDTTNIPLFPNGRRVAVLQPRQLRQLKSDQDFARYVEFFRDVNPMFGSYIGTIGKVDIFKSNTLTSKNNSSTVSIKYGQMFGPSMVGMGIGGVPRVLAASDDNYGLQAKVIWEFQFGLVSLDDRFGCSIRTS